MNNTCNTYRIVDVDNENNKEKSKLLTDDVETYAKKLVKTLTGTTNDKKPSTSKPKPSKPKPSTSAKPYTQDAKYPKLENYGKNVLSVQKLLNKAGYKVDEDSSFGPSTDRALRQFQKDNGLAVDGQAGPATQKALKRGANKGNISVDGS